MAKGAGHVGRGGKRARPRLRSLLLAGLVLVALDQLLQWTALTDGRFLGQRLIPFDPPIFSSTQESLLRRYESELADPALFERRSMFDRELGWCPRPGMRQGDLVHDWAGARIGRAPLPREPEPDRRLVALVGCSFTEGHEVPGPESWASLVEERGTALVVANFGVGGYGVDQALLRARRDALPLEPDELWLGFFPGGALRVTTLFPPIQYQWRARGVLFKPRFVLGPEEELELVPSPARLPGDVPRLLRDQRALVDAIGASDLWVRRYPAAYAPRGSTWLHRSAFARLGLTWLEHRGRRVEPWLRDEASEVYRLHRAMILALRADAAARGARFRVVVLPAARDLEQRARDGAGYWESLTRELVDAGVELLDTSAALAEARGSGGATLWMPGGHYSPRANALVAEAIAGAWLADD